VVVLLLWLLNRGGHKNKTVAARNTTTSAAASTTTAPKTSAKVCPKPDGSSPRATSFDGPPTTCIDPTKTYTAKVETDEGNFTITLDAKQAPKTVNNFVFLARYHFYDGILFHRVIPDFVVQGGDPEATGTGGPGYRFADELPASVDAYKAGSVAMANSGPNTNGSQFFIVVSDAGGKQLQAPKYSLFGQVTEGLDVVKKIEADGSPSGTPKAVHQMIRVTIAES
jgi:cyclophilin family peptidyl-prolyl cis-trans isomerase